MGKVFLQFFLLFILFSVMSCATTQLIEPLPQSNAEVAVSPSVSPEPETLVQIIYEDWSPERIVPPATPQALPRLLALWWAYPEKVKGLRPTVEDWIVSIGSTEFRWAEGRMLFSSYPFTQREQEQYLPIWDLAGLDIPIWERKILGEAEVPFLDLNNTYGFDPRIRNQVFLDLLYDAPDQESSESRMVWVRLLGLPLQVHPWVVPALERVDSRVRALAESRTEVGQFIEDLEQVWGFFWRPIAGTSRRSMHSYGIAIDLIPEYYGRRFPYWRWALESGYPRWWTLSPRDYWRPPPEVVRVFEEEGFLWGGRWSAFDTVHFEYRPEYMIFEEPLRLPVSKP